jgi:hypothetical protein
MKTNWIIALLLAIETSAQARIGETEHQIALRYSRVGIPSLEGRDPLGNTQHAYKFRQFIVMVSFENGFSVCENFVRRADGTHENRLRPNEIESILKANAASGVRWKEIIEHVVWETSDGRLEAINRFGHLQVSTKEYADKIATANKQKKRAKASEH